MNLYELDERSFFLRWFLKIEVIRYKDVGDSVDEYIILHLLVKSILVWRD